MAGQTFFQESFDQPFTTKTQSRPASWKAMTPESYSVQTRILFAQLQALQLPSIPACELIWCFRG
jgi:hypothetical protein